MNRLAKLQDMLIKYITEEVETKNNRAYPLSWEIVHIASAPQFARLLAEKRGVDPELAAIATAVHDFGRIVTGVQENHAEAGYEPVKKWLAETGLFSEEEIETIALACKNHSSKEEVGTPLEEIVKDSDIIDCYLHGHVISKDAHRKRLAKVKKELNLPEEQNL
ncbi:MAG: HD domain-containing protein [Thermoanaerobacteraceae bacterium]|nr:HD domain-containing protein [Thermoanaerobacteraceae bacterium]